VTPGDGSKFSMSPVAVAAKAAAAAAEPPPAMFVTAAAATSRLCLLQWQQQQHRMQQLPSGRSAATATSRLLRPLTGSKIGNSKAAATAQATFPQCHRPGEADGWAFSEGAWPREWAQTQFV